MRPVVKRKAAAACQESFETQMLLHSSDGYSGSRSLACVQKSHSVPVKLWLKSKAGFSTDVPDTLRDDRERRRSREAQVETVKLKWSHTNCCGTAAQSDFRT